jgi:WD40 repeat protein
MTIPNNSCCIGSGASPIQGLVWSPDNAKVAVFGASYKLDVYDATNGNLVWEKTVSVGGSDNDLSWSPDGKNIAVGGAFFSSSTGDSVQVFDQNPNDSMVPKVLAWSPDSRYVLTKKEKLIELRNAHSGRLVLSILEIPEPSYWFQNPKVVANWNLQSNRFVFTDAGSGIYVYHLSQP